MSSCKTIRANSKGEYKEKGSRFLAFAFPVESESVINTKLTLLRKEHFKARHICYAYKLDGETPLSKVQDDGEPVHTAGQPIMNQIEKLKLQNILVVVARYFGGVLLGKGGLIRAYGTAAEEALGNAIIIDYVPTTIIEINIPQKNYALFMHVISKYQHTIIDEFFSNECRLTIEINQIDKNRFLTETEKYSTL